MISGVCDRDGNISWTYQWNNVGKLLFRNKATYNMKTLLIKGTWRMIHENAFNKDKGTFEMLLTKIDNSGVLAPI